jgi:NADH-quinone oxidoreductase subunit L
LIYSAWLAWIVPLASVPLVPLASRMDGRLRGWVAVAAAGLSLASATYGALTFGSDATESIAVWFPSFDVSLQVKVDGLSVLVGAFVSLVSFLVVVYSLGYMKDEEGQTRYYSLVLLFVGSMMGLVMSGNLIQFYFFWEVVGVCSALLIAFWSDREAARKAGLKAFAVTRVGDASLLIAVVYIATTFGTTTFDSILKPSALSNLASGTLFALGLLILIGAMGKSAQVPLHSWLPDAMEGPTTVSALIHAATMVNAGVFLMVRMYPLFQLSSTLLTVVLAVGLASALVGGLCAFAADDIKRVLAYSTISQLGLMFAALGLGAMQTAVYHMVSQGLFKALAFLAAGSVVTALGTREMQKMGGLSKTMKYTYLGFLLSVLAMSGLPPLVGFWSKEAILSSALSTGVVAAMVVLGVFSLTALYGFRALCLVFHGRPRSAVSTKDPPPSMLAPILTLGLMLATAWTVLQVQPLVSFGSFGVEPLLLSASLIVLASSAGAAYLVELPRHEAAVQYLLSRKALRALRRSFFEGFWFDRLYSSVYADVVSPLSKAASRLQTGLLRANVAMAVLLVGVLFVLYASGVL